MKTNCDQPRNRSSLTCGSYWRRICWRASRRRFAPSIIAGSGLSLLLGLCVGLSGSSWADSGTSGGMETPALEILLEHSAVRDRDASSYRTFEYGSVGRAGRWGGGWSQGGRYMKLWVELRHLEAGPRATVTSDGVEIWSGDLGDLRTHSIELGTGDDGYTHYLNLVPQIMGSTRPLLRATKVDVAAFSVGAWEFARSAVVLDDLHYAGVIESAVGGPVAWIEIPGEAFVVFSLESLPEASPVGRWQDGRLTLPGPEAREIEVFGVEVTGSEDLDPATPADVSVWVRWLPARVTRAQAADERSAAFERYLPGLSQPERSRVLQRIREGYSCRFGVGGASPLESED